MINQQRKEGKICKQKSHVTDIQSLIIKQVIRIEIYKYLVINECLEYI
jgi:hypothetical protein